MKNPLKRAATLDRITQQFKQTAAELTTFIEGTEATLEEMKNEQQHLDERRAVAKGDINRASKIRDNINQLIEG